MKPIVSSCKFYDFVSSFNLDLYMKGREYMNLTAYNGAVG